MIREERFLISRRPYAIDLGSLRPTGSNFWRLDAVWFRRRRGITVACIGYLHDLQNPPPTTTAEFLARADDGRYGGHCEGRWDGQRYWGAQEPEIAAAHLALLRPMLERFPAVPAGFDGWWTFAGGGQ